MHFITQDSPSEHGFPVRDKGVGFSAGMVHAGQLFGVFRHLHSAR